MKAWLLDSLKSLRAKLAKIHKSVTIWFNGIAGSLVIILPFALEQWPQLQGTINDHFYHVMLDVIIIGNIVARFISTKSLADK